MSGVYEARLWEVSGRWRWALVHDGEVVRSGVKSCSTKAIAVAQAKAARKAHEQEHSYETITLEDE